MRYVHYDSGGKDFSIGFARNFGAQCANGRAIAFLDIDLRVPSDFWERLLQFNTVIGISKFKRRYFAIPCLYLTEMGTREFLAAPPKSRTLEFLMRWLSGDTNSVQILAPCSSFMVVDRLHYLSVGGHSCEFDGHGYEDFELHHRLVAEANAFQRPVDYYHDYQDWEAPSYIGFRAQFSLLGRRAMFANLVAVHLWHPRPPESSFYQAKPSNQHRLVAAMKTFDEERVHPQPLIANEAQRDKFMFLGQPNGNSARTLRDVFPLMGSPIYINEFDFVDNSGGFSASKFEVALKSKGIGRVLLPNPYRNIARQAIYNWCRTNQFPYLVFERGALPNSWFFDQRGFNADSSSYCPLHWDRELTQEQTNDVQTYIRWCLAGYETLEKQGARVGSAALAAKLNVGDKKVLFVPLQRPSDTVTVHMAGTAKSVSSFLTFIDSCAKYLTTVGWVVLCKRHPYEDSSQSLHHASYVDPDVNFLDLLGLADSVALMNSSVGLYAMMLGKPCYVFSNAFYSFTGLNEAIRSLEVPSFCARVQEAMPIDMTSVDRFVHYLIKEFYSFGRASYQTWQESDGSSRKAARSIDFHEIRLPGIQSWVYKVDNQKEVPLRAPLFERYRMFLDQGVP